MVIKLSRYSSGFRYAATAYDWSTAHEITSRGLNAVLIDAGVLTLLPDCIELRCTGNAAAMCSSLQEYDVVEITESGTMRRLYGRDSNSNCIVVTSMCNSNCIMCPSPVQSRQRREISSIEDLCHFIDYIPKSAVHIAVTGGEPTLLKHDFFKLMSKLNEALPNTVVQYLSNARAFSDARFAQEFCDRATKLTRIAVPIHGSTAMLHDSITQTPGSFEQTVTAIQNLAHSIAEIELRVVVSRLNVEDLSMLAKFVVHTFPRVTCVNFIALEMSGSAAVNRDALWVDYAVACEKTALPCKILMAGEIDVNLYNFPLCSVNPDYWGIARQSISDYKTYYSDGCAVCSVKGICGGQFAATAALHLFQVRPVRSEP